jgi:hypothetical protein
MRITESTLRQLIRETLLTEAMITPDTAVEMGLTFEISSGEKLVEITATGPDGSGSISASLVRGPLWHPSGWGRESMRLWVVESSKVSIPGLGPLLYDLLMDAVHPDPIASDRDSVSASAKRVWDYYLNSRPDIESIQLDDPDDKLTPTHLDNFDQHSAMNWVGYDGWPKSSLSKAYRRKDGRTPTLLALWNLDILQMV